VRTLSESRKCQCGSALKYAIITDRNAVPAETLTRLAPIVGKYLGGA
jgi:5'-methylthioadenosine phosphorylase